MQAMIDMADQFVQANEAAIASVEALKAAIDGLDSKVVTVTVKYITEGKPTLDGGGTTTRTINEVVNPIIRDQSWTGGATGGFTEQTIGLEEMKAAAAQLQEQMARLTASEDGASQAAANYDRNLESAMVAANGLNSFVNELNSTFGKGSVAANNMTVAQRQLYDAVLSDLEATKSQSDALQALEMRLGTGGSALKAYEANLQGIAADMAKVDQSAASTASVLDAASAALKRGQQAEAAYVQGMDEVSKGNIYAGAAAAIQAGDQDRLAVAMAAAKNMGDSLRGTTDGNSLAMLALAQNTNHAGTSMLGAAAQTFAVTAGMTLWAGAIHWVVMGTSEFLAVFIPAMFAAGAATAAAWQGVQTISRSMNALYTATEATSKMLHETMGNALGMKSVLQQAQDAANPRVYTMLGEAIGTASKSMGLLLQFAQPVLIIMEQFGAKLQLDIVQFQKTGQAAQLLGNAVQDLVMFGQIIGNLGHALLNFASVMPGLAEVLLKVVDGFSRLVLWVSNLKVSIAGINLITLVLAFEEAYRWSGLAAAGFGLLGKAIELLGTLGLPIIAKIGGNVAKMGSSIVEGIGGAVINLAAIAESGFGLFGTKMAGAAKTVDNVAVGIVGKLGAAATFLSGPWGAAIGVAAAAVGVLVIALMHHHNAIDTFIADNQKAVASATNMDVLNVIGQKLQLTNQMITQQTKALNASLDYSGQSLSGASAKYDLFNRTAMVTSGTIDKLRQEQRQLVSDNVNVISGAAQISQAYGVNFSAALGMADAAGVKLASSMDKNGKLTAQAAIQVDSLYQSYKAMDQTGTTLANDMQVGTIAAGLQASKVQQLNQSWDQFIGMGTSLTGTYAQLQLDMQQLGNTASPVGAKIQAFTGTTVLSLGQIQNALKTFTGDSAQVWQSYNQSITQANSFTDSLRVAAAAGVVNQKQYTQAVATTAGQLLPYAKNSQAALAELSMLVQEAGGPASSNFATLKGWIDKNAVSGDAMNQMLTTMTSKITNVGQVAKNFAGTLQTDVTSAMAQAAVGTSNITGLTSKYTTALQQNDPASQAVKTAQQDLDAALKKLGYTQTDVNQINQILTNTYGQNTTATQQNQSAADSLSGHLTTLQNGHLVPLTNEQQANITKTQAMGKELGINLPGHIDSANSKMDASKNGPIAGLTNAINTLATDVGKMAQDFSGKWPTNEHTSVTVSAGGGANVKSSVAGVSGGSVSVTGYATGSRFAGGGVLPGYAPGHDTVPALLSPGEGILIPQATRMLGGERGIHSINRAAQRFASGGVALPNLFKWGTAAVGDAGITIRDTFAKVLTAEVQSIVNSTKSSIQNQANALAAKYAGQGGSDQANIALGSKMAGAYGWSGLQFLDLAALWTKESGWSSVATNPTSGAAGIAQNISGYSAGYQKGNAAEQIAWGLAYIKSRYGSPAAAWAHETAFNWYDQGGMLGPGLTLAMNNTGQPEKVTPPGGDSGGAQVIHNHISIDGREFANVVTPYLTASTGRYALRNSGKATGVWKPV